MTADRGAHPEQPSAGVTDRVVGGDPDQDEERDADEGHVAPTRTRRRPRASLPVAGHQRRAKRAARRLGPETGRPRRGSASSTLNPPSAQTSAAGRTARTPASATARSSTVTSPKSLNMRMSETINTAKPAIAVTPEASTAAPVREYARRRASPSDPPAARSSWKRAARITLNSVAIAITRAPSVAESGFSGTPEMNSTSDDHPVAKTIGISGTRARRAER